MLQVGGERDLTLESCGAYLAREFRWQDLDDHLPVERPLRGEEKTGSSPHRVGAPRFNVVGITEYRLDALR